VKYLYGPVPSRRLGMSLGIDPFETKTCTHNCIYCQLGSGKTVSSEQSLPGVPLENIERELIAFFADGGDTDYITFSGSGEPTLWNHIEKLIQFIKTNFADKKLAVITNGTTLWRDEIRKAIMPIDLIVPTIAAADEDTYQRLHRPNPSADFSRHIEGTQKFAQEFDGEIWAEVLLVAGVNDSTEHLAELAKIIYKTNPDYIDLNPPVRPPAERWVHPPDEAVIRRAYAILGPKCRIVGQFVPPSAHALEVANLATRILGILIRRPETAESIADSLGIVQQQVTEALDALVAKKLAIQADGGYFEIPQK